jgi:transcriptional regulator with XRE-family HTH domain
MSENKNNITSPEDIRTFRLLKLAAKIKDRREEKEIATTQLAKELDVSISYITKLERGKILNPHPGLLKKMGDILSMDYLYLYLIMDYIDENTFEIFQSKRGGFCITDVEVIKGFDKKNSEKRMGKIKYLSKIEDGKDLKGYLINESLVLGGKPKYTYAIINKKGKVDNDKICLFNLDGELVLRRYVYVEGREILIDPQNSFNSRGISNKDNIENMGTLVDIVIDLDGSKLKEGKDLPILNPSSLYGRRKEPK